MIKSLIKLASYLDINGYIAEANDVDGLIKKHSEWSESELDEVEFKSELDEVEFKTVSDGEHRELIEVWCPSYRGGGGGRLITPDVELYSGDRSGQSLTLTGSVRVRGWLYPNQESAGGISPLDGCGTLAFFIRKGRYTPVEADFKGFRIASAEERDFVKRKAKHPHSLMAGNPGVFWMVVANEIDRSFNGEFKFRIPLDNLQRVPNEEVWWTCVDCSSSRKAPPPESNEEVRDTKGGNPEDESESELNDDRSIRDLYRWHLEQSEEE